MLAPSVGHLHAGPTDGSSICKPQRWVNYMLASTVCQLTAVPQHQVTKRISMDMSTVLYPSAQATYISAHEHATDVNSVFLNRHCTKCILLYAVRNTSSARLQEDLQHSSSKLSPGPYVVIIMLQRDVVILPAATPHFVHMGFHVT